MYKKGDLTNYKDWLTFIEELNPKIEVLDKMYSYSLGDKISIRVIDDMIKQVISHIIDPDYSESLFSIDREDIECICANLTYKCIFNIFGTDAINCNEAFKKLCNVKEYSDRYDDTYAESHEKIFHKITRDLLKRNITNFFIKKNSKMYISQEDEEFFKGIFFTQVDVGNTNEKKQFQNLLLNDNFLAIDVKRYNEYLREPDVPLKCLFDAKTMIEKEWVLNSDFFKVFYAENLRKKSETPDKYFEEDIASVFLLTDSLCGVYSYKFLNSYYKKITSTVHTFRKDLHSYSWQEMYLYYNHYAIPIVVLSVVSIILKSKYFLLEKDCNQEKSGNRENKDLTKFKDQLVEKYREIIENENRFCELIENEIQQNVSDGFNSYKAESVTNIKRKFESFGIKGMEVLNWKNFTIGIFNEIEEKIKTKIETKGKKGAKNEKKNYSTKFSNLLAGRIQIYEKCFGNIFQVMKMANFLTEVKLEDMKMENFLTEIKLEDNVNIVKDLYCESSYIYMPEKKSYISSYLKILDKTSKELEDWYNSINNSADI
jgi:hypothetical protein